MNNFSLEAAKKAMGGEAPAPAWSAGTTAPQTDYSQGIDGVLYGGAVPLDDAMSDVPKPNGVSGFTSAFLGKGAQIARKESEVKQLMSAAQRGITPEEFYMNQRQEMQTAQVDQEDLMLGVVASLLSDNRFKAKLAASPYLAAIQRANQANEFGIKENRNLADVVNNSADNQTQFDVASMNDDRMREVADQADATRREGINAGLQKSYDASQIKLRDMARDEWDGVVKEMWADGNLSLKEQQQLQGLLPRFLSNRGVPVELADGFKIPGVGQTPSAANMVRDDARTAAKFKFDAEKWNKDFKLKTDTLKQRDKQFTMSHAEKVREFDKSFNEKVREFEATNKRQLSRDEWQAAYQSGMLGIASDREARMATGGGGQSSGGGLARGNVTPQGVTKWKQEFVKTFKDSAPEQFGPGSVKTSAHKEGKGLDLKFKDAKKNNPSELRPMFEHAKSQKVPYIIFDGRSYTLDENSGAYKVAKYNGPHPHDDHVHIDWHQWDNKGGKPSGMGIPKSESNAQGGNGRQRTQAQLDRPSQNPPTPQKPAGSKPEANGGQSTNKTKSGDTFRFGGKK